MRRLIIIGSLWAILLATPFAGSNGAATQPDPVTPAAKAVMTGPTKVDQAKTPIVIRTEGSVGKNLKFSMSPKIAQSFSFRDEQTGELVFLYVPENPGVYSVALAASDATGKLDVQILQTTVGGVSPTPPPPPPPPPVPVDSLVKLYGDAAATDVAAGVGTKAQISTLANLYTTASTVTCYNTGLLTPQSVYDTLHAAALQQGVADGALPSLRKTMAVDQKAYFNFPAGATFATAPLGDKGTRDQMANYFKRIGSALTTIAQ